MPQFFSIKINVWVRKELLKEVNNWIHHWHFPYRNFSRIPEWKQRKIIDNANRNNERENFSGFSFSYFQEKTFSFDRTESDRERYTNNGNVIYEWFYSSDVFSPLVCRFPREHSNCSSCQRIKEARKWGKFQTPWEPFTQTPTASHFSLANYQFRRRLCEKLARVCMTCGSGRSQVWFFITLWKRRDVASAGRIRIYGTWYMLETAIKKQMERKLKRVRVGEIMNLIVKFNKDDVACTPHISDTSNYHKINQNDVIEWDQ